MKMYWENSDLYDVRKHYKLNDIANSIYYYEKALLLNPNSETINNNLVFAQNMLIDKIEILPISLLEIINFGSTPEDFALYAK